MTLAVKDKVLILKDKHPGIILKPLKHGAYFIRWTFRNTAYEAWIAESNVVPDTTPVKKGKK